ncbi:MAG: hypothetical protein AB1631_17475 [Acidobacteriota bacterium]
MSGASPEQEIYRKAEEYVREFTEADRLDGEISRIQTERDNAKARARKIAEELRGRIGRNIPRRVVVLSGGVLIITAEAVTFVKDIITK